MSVIGVAMLTPARLRPLWALLWLGSLALPVAATGPHPTDFGAGWLILCTGWLGVIVLQFGWFANIAFIIAVVRFLLRRSGKVGDTAILAVLVPSTLDALLWRQMYGDNGSVPIQVFGVGYYLWFAAMAGMTLSLLLSVKSKT
jgi:hypothetical protein